MRIGCDGEMPLVGAYGAKCAMFLAPDKLDMREKILHGSAWAYHDGFNLEFGIRPEEDLNRVIANVREGIRESMLIADSLGLGVPVCDGWEIDHYDIKDKKGWDVSGCNPTHNPMNGLTATPPFPDYGEYMLKNGTLCGCHIHLGDDQLAELAKDGAKSIHCDIATILALCVPAHILLMLSGQGIDLEWTKKRWQKLGIGNFRVPPHGFEYKDPGSIILASPALFVEIAEIVRAIVKACLKSESFISKHIGGMSLSYALENVTGDKFFYEEAEEVVQEAMGMCGEREVFNLRPPGINSQRAWLLGAFEDKYTNGALTLEALK